MYLSGSPARGMLFLVVGASGVGKDTLMERARDEISAHGTHIFARRVITRPREAGGEDHEPVSATGFAALVAEKAFALRWSAHGLHYGIRNSTTDRLAEGTHVVANVSRAVIDAARASFRPIRVLYVTASPDVLRERLRLRGRETSRDIEARLARALAAEPSGPDVVTIRNDGSLDQAVRPFVAALSPFHPTTTADCGSQ